MLAKPNFAAVLLLFAGIIVTMLIAVLPSPHGVWEAIDSHSYSRYVLRHTDLFTGPLRVHSDTGVEQPTRAFRTLLRAKDARASLAFLADSASPAGRLYALAGLTLIDPAATAALRSDLGSRTDTVSFIRGCEDLVRLPVRELVPLAVDSTFAASLRDDALSCGLFRLVQTG